MSLQGLTSAEAISRHAMFGPNSIPESGQRTLLLSILVIVREPMIILLISAGIINLILAEPIDAVLLTATIFIIIGGITVIFGVRTVSSRRG